ncbi:MAG TPA: serine hydrolase domain-containing protein [Chitinophaga sp.]|uniref:serine hydrolase domain-containing protein n=1 Tax=Chitinophaga sp. TaxID=1869181 RepID=UPI002DC032FD|nr:serine hydrolase domain-containing protein [Chitinophaga sp.]HEU4556119.1 serine hydrolase domain-containing protein [Chitinophaga sp.]
MIRSIYIILINFILFPAFTFAQADNVEACIGKIMQQSDMAGLAVAVVKGNRIIYTHSYGYKNLETKTRLTDDCLFRIASISKSFTATSLMQLVEAKKISLNDDVSGLIGFRVRNPRFPDKVITLRMILSHTSGINDSQGYFSLDAINPDKNPGWAKCYNDYAPGAGYMYCNLNFNMAGTILERVSGERFDQYVKHHILDPLGLYGGYCVDSLDQSRFATLYEYNTDSARLIPAYRAYDPHSEEIAHYTMGYSAPVFSPTGGMKIAAADLARYMIMHMNLGKYGKKRILSKKSARLMQSKIAKQAGYGLAIMTRDSLIDGKVLKGHTGSAYGLNSAMFFEPREKFGIVAITNGYHSNTPGGLKTIVNCLYDHLIRKEK